MPRLIPQSHQRDGHKNNDEAQKYYITSNGRELM